MWAEHSWIIPIHLWEDERLEPEKLGPPRKEDEHQNSQAIIFSGSIVNLPRCKLSGFEFLSNPSVKKRRVDVPIIPSARIPHTGCQKIQVLGRGSKHLLNFHPLLLGGDGIQLDGCIFFKRVRKNHQVCNVFFWTWGTVNTQKRQIAGCSIFGVPNWLLDWQYIPGTRHLLTSYNPAGVGGWSSFQRKISKGQAWYVLCLQLLQLFIEIYRYVYMHIFI